MKLQFHPIAEIFPLIEGDLFTDFVEDIRSYGQREAITLHTDSRILDGRNRYRACEILGIEPITKTWDGQGSPTDYVLSLNLQRRNLTPSQAAMVAVLALPIYEAEALELMADGGVKAGRGRPTEKGGADLHHPIRGPRSTDHAARQVGVSGRLVASAKRISEQAPELVEQIVAGTISVTGAEAMLVNQHNESLLEVAEESRLAGVAAGQFPDSKKPLPKPRLPDGAIHPWAQQLKHVKWELSDFPGSIFEDEGLRVLCIGLLDEIQKELDTTIQKISGTINMEET